MRHDGGMFRIAACEFLELAVVHHAEPVRQDVEAELHVIDVDRAAGHVGSGDLFFEARKFRDRLAR